MKKYIIIFILSLVLVSCNKTEQKQQLNNLGVNIDKQEVNINKQEKSNSGVKIKEQEVNIKDENIDQNELQDDIIKKITEKEKQELDKKYSKKYDIISSIINVDILDCKDIFDLYGEKNSEKKVIKEKYMKKCEEMKQKKLNKVDDFRKKESDIRQEVYKYLDKKDLSICNKYLKDEKQIQNCKLGIAINYPQFTCEDLKEQTLIKKCSELKILKEDLSIINLIPADYIVRDKLGSDYFLIDQDGLGGSLGR